MDNGRCRRHIGLRAPREGWAEESARLRRYRHRRGTGLQIVRLGADAVVCSPKGTTIEASTALERPRRPFYGDRRRRRRGDNRKGPALNIARASENKGRENMIYLL